MHESKYMLLTGLTALTPQWSIYRETLEEEFTYISFGSSETFQHTQKS